MKSISVGSQSTSYIQSPNGQTTLAIMPNGKRLGFDYDSAQRLLDVKLDGVSLAGPNALRADVSGGSKATVTLWRDLLRGVLSAVPNAYAQPVLPLGRGLPIAVPGQEQFGQPSVSSWDLMMQSDGVRPVPTLTLVRRLAKALDKLCECDPNNGYNKPTLTFLSITKMIASGHVPAILGISIPGQSAFDANVMPDQLLVDTVVALAATPTETENGNLSYYVPNIGFVVGQTRRMPTKALRLIVAPNCTAKGSAYKPNEIISFYPEMEGMPK